MSEFTIGRHKRWGNNKAGRTHKNVILNNLFPFPQPDVFADMDSAIDRAVLSTGIALSRDPGEYPWAAHGGYSPEDMESVPSVEEMQLFTRTRILGVNYLPFKIPIYDGRTDNEDSFLRTATEALGLDRPMEEVFPFKKRNEFREKVRLNPLEYVGFQGVHRLLGLNLTCPSTYYTRLKNLRRLRPELDLSPKCIPIWVVPLLAALGPAAALQSRSMYEDFHLRARLESGMTSFRYGAPAFCMLGIDTMWDLKEIRGVCRMLAPRGFNLYHVGDLFGEIGIAYTGGNHVYFRRPEQHPYLFCFSKRMNLGYQIRVRGLYPEQDPEDNALRYMVEGYSLLIPPASIIFCAGNAWKRRLESGQVRIPSTTKVFYRGSAGNMRTWHRQLEDYLKVQNRQLESERKLLEARYADEFPQLLLPEIEPPV